MKKWLAVLLLVTLPAILSGCLIPTDHDIANNIQSTLHARFHPVTVSVDLHRSSIFSTKVKTLDVAMSGFTIDKLSTVTQQPAPAGKGQGGPTAVDGNARQLHQGKKKGTQVRIVDAHIHCENFTALQLPVKQADAQFREVRIPLAEIRKGQFTVPAMDSAHGSVLLEDKGLTQFIRTRHLPITDPVIRITKDRCIVSGIYHTLVNVPVEVSGRLMVKKPATVYLDHPELHLSVVPMPKMITDKLLGDMNPLIDVNAELGLPVQVVITKITHEDGAIRFEGMLDTPHMEK
ncbi:MAG TPA: LmeA family phospholipid-binding protein [Armatimonadota bacterium]|nr:LmeA family phospholipid-binding protein [Armatimonadota bacterium]